MTKVSPANGARHVLWLCMALLASAPGVRADDWSIAWGGGPENGGVGQTNHATALEYVFYDYERSAQQTLSIGVSYNYLRTNTDFNQVIHAVSLFPQVLARARPGSLFDRLAPFGSTPFIFARALGPTWMSDDRFGELQQENDFSFQAQVGAGLSFQTNGGRHIRLAMSWKHFSNANLFSDNDGFDFPLTLSLTTRAGARE